MNPVDYPAFYFIGGRQWILVRKSENIYFKYLVAAFGSAMITSIYSIVDMAMVGPASRPHRHSGTGGGSTHMEYYLQPGFAYRDWRPVLYSHARGKSTKEEANEFFTVAFIGTVLFVVASWWRLCFLKSLY